MICRVERRCATARLHIDVHLEAVTGWKHQNVADTAASTTVQVRLYSQAGAEFDGMDCTPVSNAVHCPVAPVTELIDVKMSIYC